MSRRSTRRGYAMALVVIFIALVNLFFMLGWKHLTAAIRVQDSFQTAKQRDEGSLVALATGIAQLETAYPTYDATTGGYLYGMTINGRQFKVTYAPPDPFNPESAAPQTFGISVQYQSISNPLLRNLLTQYPDPPP